MKLRLYHRSVLVVLLFAIWAVILFVLIPFSPAALRVVLSVVCGIYGTGTTIALLLAARVAAVETDLDIQTPERLLIVAPHQDDCVLIAGGLGLRNSRLGGETHIVYLTEPDEPITATTRFAEAMNAWKLAGVPEQNLHRRKALPKKGQVSPVDVKRLYAELQTLVDDLLPTMICVPLFEGGHLHHDLAHHTVTRMIRTLGGTKILQGPEYSPYFSLWQTPQKALSFLTRFGFLGMVSYYASPEGVGLAGIANLRMTRKELAVKRRMLRQFRSQNGDSLARNHGYADRLILWKPTAYRSTPFEFQGSLASALDRLMYFVRPSVVRRAFPGYDGTIGVARGITNLDQYVP